jgi:hypothetical protein
MKQSREEKEEGKPPHRSPRDAAFTLLAPGQRETVLKLAAEQGIVGDDPPVVDAGSGDQGRKCGRSQPCNPR